MKTNGELYLQTSPERHLLCYYVRVLCETYINWINNYVGIDTFAEHNGLSDDQALKLIEIAKAVYNSPANDF